jgi:hypothetical protein
MKSPFAQPEKSRLANATIAKSRVLAAQVLRILSREGFGTFFKASERHSKGTPLSIRRQVRSHAGMRRATSVGRQQPPRKIPPQNQRPSSLLAFGDFRT